MTAATRRSTSAGYTTGIIDQAQFSVLVAVVVLSAVVPTAIAQRLFTPKLTRSPEPVRATGSNAQHPTRQ
jgi:hypothetical protein